MGRDKNRFANALATLASMTKIDCGNKIQPISIEVRNCLAFCCSVKEEMDENSWYHDMKQFIQHQKYPWKASNIDMKTLWRMTLD